MNRPDPCGPLTPEQEVDLLPLERAERDLAIALVRANIANTEFEKSRAMNERARAVALCAGLRRQVKP